MATTFDLPSWLTPDPGWTGADSFIKGSQAGAAIAANRIRAKQVYADIRQNQQRLDIAEREQVTRDEASDLRNEVIRTKMANDAADFETLRQWWPSFQASEGEIDMPVLRDETTMLKVSAAVAEKRSKIGQAAFAELMAEPGFDLAEPINQKRYFELMSKYKNIPAKLGPDGVMGPIKVAESLKRLRDEADSRIAARVDRARLNSLIEARRSLLADSTINVNDARIGHYDKEINLEERRLLVSEGNLALRGQEINQKETRLGLREQYLNERNALNSEEKAKLELVTTDPAETDRLRKLYNLKRREITRKFYGPNPTAAPSAIYGPAKDSPDHMPAFPAMPGRKEDLKVDETYITPLGPALWDGAQFIAQ